jgi:hypothetical protein
MLICFCFACVLCFAWLVKCCIAPCYLILVLVVAPLLCFVGSHYHLLTALCWWLSTLPYGVLLMVVNASYCASFVCFSAPLLCFVGGCWCPSTVLCWCVSLPPCYIMLVLVNAPLLCSIGVCHHHLATFFWCLSNPFVAFYWCSSWPFAAIFFHIIHLLPFTSIIL